mmetsp:Transcript_125214/g.401112  ORF Transcript_125214/g.401112 Transcript_125214/m.401112 type:complete len:223 (-) Transcript_125214:1031-1699(-)
MAGCPWPHPRAPRLRSASGPWPAASASDGASRCWRSRRRKRSRRRRSLAKRGACPLRRATGRGTGSSPAVCIARRLRTPSRLCSSWATIAALRLRRPRAARACSSRSRCPSGPSWRPCRCPSPVCFQEPSRTTAPSSSSIGTTLYARQPGSVACSRTPSRTTRSGSTSPRTRSIRSIGATPSPLGSTSRSPTSPKSGSTSRSSRTQSSAPSTLRRPLASSAS